MTDPSVEDLRTWGVYSWWSAFTPASTVRAWRVSGLG